MPVNPNDVLMSQAPPAADGTMSQAPMAVETLVPQIAAPVPVAADGPPLPTTSPFVLPNSPVTPPNSQFALTNPTQQQQVSNYIQPSSVPILSVGDLPPDVGNALTAPTSEQIQAEFMKMAAPYQQEKARMAAMDAVDKMRMDAEDRQKKRESALDDQIAKIDSRVRTKSFSEIFQSGSVGSKIGAAIAIMAGGASQALTGAKSNPVIDFMDSAVEQQAKKDRLSMEEKEALRRQVYEQGQTEIKKLENATNNAFRKDQLAQMNREFQLKREETFAKLKANVAASMPKDIFSGRELSKEELMQARADKNLAKNIIMLPNGKSFLGTNATDASEFKKFSTESFNALNLLEEYRKLGENGRKYSLTDRARANTLRTALVGALRLPFTGPGVMTLEEREALIKTLGDPLSLTTLRPIELAKIQQIKDALKVNTINKARLSGITGDLFDDAKYYNVGGRAMREDTLVKSYMQKMPSLSEEQVKAAMRKQFPGL